MSGASAKKTASQSRQDHSFGPHPNPSSAPVLTVAAASVPLTTVIPPPPFPLTFLCCSCFSFSRGSPSHVRIFLQLSPAAPAEPNPSRLMRRAITTQSRRISEPALPQPFPDLFKLSPVHLNAAPSVTEGKDCVFVSIHVFFFLLLFFSVYSEHVS